MKFPERVLIALVVVACRPTGDSENTVGRYVVTANPINIGVGSGRFCVAADPTDPKGVWWWQPGPSDCSSRSTGPTVFHAENAAVSPSAQAGATDIRFRIPLKRAPGSPHPAFVHVWLVLEAGHMRAPATAAQVSTARRKDLNVPESW